MERWGFLFSAVSSPIVYFLTTTRAVCPNNNPIMLDHFSRGAWGEFYHVGFNGTNFYISD